MSYENQNIHLSEKNTIGKKPVKCKKIGNYLIVKTIGKGTFGKVKIGIHMTTQQKVAIKILDKSKIRSEQDIERISREIQILKLIRHKNIVQLYDTVTSDRNIYLIMEYIEGGDLHQYINNRRQLNEMKTCFIFNQLISTIEYIHKLGIAHRDIKPENILLDDKFNAIKLVDFGLSNSYKHGEYLKTACGSPCYAAPEMIAGRYYNGMSSDLWSCGVVLFCMLCGYLPFDDNNIKSLYSKISKGEYEIDHSISSYGKDILQRILVVDPSRRANIEEIKSHPWMKMIQIPEPDKGILIGVDKIEIDSEIVDKVVDLMRIKNNIQINYEEVKKSVLNNKHNSITTAYYIMFKEKVRRIELDANLEFKKQFENYEMRELKQNLENIVNTSSNQMIINTLTSNNDISAKNTFLNETTTNIRDNNYILNPAAGKNFISTFKKIQTHNYSPTKIDKSLNVVVINNILTDCSKARNSLGSKSKPKANIFIDKSKIKENLLSNINYSLIKNKLSSLTKGKFIKRDSASKQKQIVVNTLVKEEKVDNKFIFVSPENSREELPLKIQDVTAKEETNQTSKKQKSQSTKHENLRNNKINIFNYKSFSNNLIKNKIIKQNDYSANKSDANSKNTTMKKNTSLTKDKQKNNITLKKIYDNTSFNMENTTNLSNFNKSSNKSNNNTTLKDTSLNQSNGEFKAKISSDKKIHKMFTGDKLIRNHRNKNYEAVQFTNTIQINDLESNSDIFEKTNIFNNTLNKTRNLQDDKLILDKGISNTFVAKSKPNFLKSNLSITNKLKLHYNPVKVTKLRNSSNIK